MLLLKIVFPFISFFGSLWVVKIFTGPLDPASAGIGAFLTFGFICFTILQAPLYEGTVWGKCTVSTIIVITIAYFAVQRWSIILMPLSVASAVIPSILAFIAFCFSVAGGSVLEATFGNPKRRR